MSNQENNKMISEFMGLELEETLEGLFVYAKKEQSPIKLNDIRTEFYEVHELQYHISWNWLMDVVEKIEDMGCEVVIANGECTISGACGMIIKSIGKSRRGATYDAIVEFINEYNKNK